MARKIEEKLTKKEIEKLLKEQTRVILDAVDEKVLKLEENVNARISKLEGRIVELDERILKLEKRVAKLEIKMEQRFDQLITTLDKFLKRLTDLEDEFTIMKAEIRKIKEILKEKLGVEIE
jgi:uncharacterized protein involved in exopolysaccharide biosynthesis